MKTSRVAVGFSTIVGKIFSIVGFTLAGLGALVLIVDLAEGHIDSTAPYLFGMLIPGILLIIQGGRIKRRIRRFRAYVALIASGMDSIDAIAISTGRAAPFVVKDLETMIRKRYFSEASIDHSANRIVIGGHSASHGFDAPPVPPGPHGGGGHEQVIMDAYSCPGCGASGTKQRGMIATCEYCGSSIK